MPYPAKTSPEEILEVALRLLEEEGPEGLSMRRLASAIGVRASSLYRHYGSREALEWAMADEGYRLLRGALAEAVDGRAPAEAMRAGAAAYVEFARRRAGVYDLMLAPREPGVAEPGPGKDLWNVVLGVVGAVTGRADDTAGAVAFWSFLHGYVMLERTGQFGLSGPRGALERGVDALAAGLREA